MNILQRYVSGEVLRAFLLSLLTMTAIFVLFMVAAQAMRIRLLTPGDVAQLVPYVIPSTLPYTIPVSLLFAVTVVYGRIAGDNEIIAVKSAGLSVMTVIWPTHLPGRGPQRLPAPREPRLDPPECPPGQARALQGPRRHVLQVPQARPRVQQPAVAVPDQGAGRRRARS